MKTNINITELLRDYFFNVIENIILMNPQLAAELTMFHVH